MSKSRLTVFSFVRRFLLRLMVVLAIFWGGGIALFSVAPVPFSAVMVERQVSAWLHGNFRYVAHSDWVSMDQISPWMGLAVIAAEDQKFPEHWGFDVASIEQALAHNERNENRIRGASTISQQTAKNLFLCKVPLLGDIPVIGALFRSDSKKVSKRNLMLFIRPTIIRDRDEYRQASSGQYTAFNNAQTKQRGKESSEASLSNDLLHIYPQQETQAFRQVSAAIDAFNLGGRP